MLYHRRLYSLPTLLIGFVQTLSEQQRQQLAQEEEEARKKAAVDKLANLLDNML